MMATNHCVGCVYAPQSVHHFRCDTQGGRGAYYHSVLLLCVFTLTKPEAKESSFPCDVNHPEMIKSLAVDSLVQWAPSSLPNLSSAGSIDYLGDHCNQDSVSFLLTADTAQSFLWSPKSKGGATRAVPFIHVW